MQDTACKISRFERFTFSDNLLPHELKLFMNILWQRSDISCKVSITTDSSPRTGLENKSKSGLFLPNEANYWHAWCSG